MENPFVTTEWLAEHLSDPNIAIIDGSWYLPTEKRDPAAEYARGHIPGAIFFDVDKYSDTPNGLPHMLMAADDFARLAGGLGIGDGMKIVVYDEAGLFSAPRVRWNFLTMGAPDVVLLEGGGPKWRAEGRPITPDETKRPAATFTPRFNPAAVANLQMMRDTDRQVVDARPALRFSGEAPEPRPGVRGGHMPGAKNAPFSTLTESGVLKSADALREQFAKAGIDIGKPTVTVCGSGVTAATLKLALERAGAADVILYDGSWAEWGTRDDTPVVTGPA